MLTLASHPAQAALYRQTVEEVMTAPAPQIHETSVSMPCPLTAHHFVVAALLLLVQLQLEPAAMLRQSSSAAVLSRSAHAPVPVRSWSWHGWTLFPIGVGTQGTFLLQVLSQCPHIKRMQVSTTVAEWAQPSMRDALTSLLFDTAQVWDCLAMDCSDPLLHSLTPALLRSRHRSFQVLTAFPVLHSDTHKRTPALTQFTEVIVKILARLERVRSPMLVDLARLPALKRDLDTLQKLLLRYPVVARSSTLVWWQSPNRLVRFGQSVARFKARHGTELGLIDCLSEWGQLVAFPFLIRPTPPWASNTSPVVAILQTLQWSYRTLFEAKYAAALTLACLLMAAYGVAKPLYHTAYSAFTLIFFPCWLLSSLLFLPILRSLLLPFSCAAMLSESTINANGTASLDANFCHSAARYVFVALSCVALPLFLPIVHHLVGLQSDISMRNDIFHNDDDPRSTIPKAYQRTVRARARSSAWLEDKYDRLTDAIGRCMERADGCEDRCGLCGAILTFILLFFRLFATIFLFLSTWLVKHVLRLVLAVLMVPLFFVFLVLASLKLAARSSAGADDLKELVKFQQIAAGQRASSHANLQARLAATEQVSLQLQTNLLGAHSFVKLDLRFTHAHFIAFTIACVLTVTLGGGVSSFVGPVINSVCLVILSCFLVVWFLRYPSYVRVWANRLRLGCAISAAFTNICALIVIAAGGRQQTQSTLSDVATYAFLGGVVPLAAAPLVALRLKEGRIDWEQVQM